MIVSWLEGVKIVVFREASVPQNESSREKAVRVELSACIWNIAILHGCGMLYPRCKGLNW